MKSLYYVFGVTKNAIGNTYEIAGSGLVALTEKVSEKDFGPSYLENNLKDMNWVNEKVVHHQNTLAAAIEHSSLIPFKFGSLFSSEEQVKSMLADRKDQFAQLLSQLENKQEYGVKLHYNDLALEKLLTESHPKLSELKEQMLSVTAGKKFMLKKKFGDLLKEEKKKEINRIRQEVYSKLNDSLRLKQLDVSPSESVIKNVLNLALLTDAMSFQEKVVPLTDMVKGPAFSIEVSGPWPAYNFVEL